MSPLARIAAVLLLTCAVPAVADPARNRDDPVARAKSHFEAGDGLYNLGRYQEAISEFAAGYRLVPKPGFLLNLGQAYRQINEIAKAREMFERFLAEAPVSDPSRSAVGRLLQELDRIPAPQVVPPPEDRAVAVVVTPPPARPELVRPRTGRRVLLGIAIGVAAAAVVGGAVGIGWAATHAPSTSLGTITVGN